MAACVRFLGEHGACSAGATLAAKRATGQAGIPHVNDEETDDIQRDAAALVELAAAQNGVPSTTEYPRSARLDGLLSEWVDLAAVYDLPAVGMAESLGRPIACYVGEVLARTQGAAWSDRREVGRRVPLLRLSSGQYLDLEEATEKILLGQASPAFHQLAATLSPRSSGDRDER